MAINSVPGVGPQNSDIAATIATTPAVSSQITASVPTAAAIATAVAAPSIGTITTAITTNAASAGVTLAAIGTQVANNSPSPANWTYIGTAAFAGAASYTFSSLSGYKRYKIVGFGTFTNANFMLQFNGDTASNYYSGYWGMFNYMSVSSASVQLSTGMLLTGPAGGGFDYEIDNANLTTVMKVGRGNTTYYGAGVGGGNSITNGIWRSTAAITSITIASTSGASLSSGNVYLMGQN
jgi:hypothetical protein